MLHCNKDDYIYFCKENPLILPLECLKILLLPDCFNIILDYFIQKNDSSFFEQNIIQENYRMVRIMICLGYSFSESRLRANQNRNYPKYRMYANLVDIKDIILSGKECISRISSIINSSNILEKKYPGKNISLFPLKINTYFKPIVCIVWINRYYPELIKYFLKFCSTQFQYDKYNNFILDTNAHLIEHGLKIDKNNKIVCIK